MKIKFNVEVFLTLEDQNKLMLIQGTDAATLISDAVNEQFGIEIEAYYRGYEYVDDNGESSPSNASPSTKPCSCSSCNCNTSPSTWDEIFDYQARKDGANYHLLKEWLKKYYNVPISNNSLPSNTCPSTK